MTDLTSAQAFGSVPVTQSEVTVTWLDSLPLEILEQVAVLLDWRSLLSLEEVSTHCRDAVTLHFGGLRVLKVSGVKSNVRNDLSRVQRAKADGYLLDDGSWTAAEFTALMSRLTGLRELNAGSPSQSRLEALAAASTSWPHLERLSVNLGWDMIYPPDLNLLHPLCASCSQLSDVTLGGYRADEAVEIVLAALPRLRALRVIEGCRGEFLSNLPPTLRELKLDCTLLQSEALAELARYDELRSLELTSIRAIDPGHLKTCLAGCVRLERLILINLQVFVTDLLPPAGLPLLRHIELKLGKVTHSDLHQLVKRQPDLESVCLSIYDASIIPNSLAPLARLSSLRSLNLSGMSGISDEDLTLLSSAPLVELHLKHWSSIPPESYTVEDLLRLNQTCPTLRTLTLHGRDGNHVQFRFGPDVEKKDLMSKLETARADMLLV